MSRREERRDRGRLPAADPLKPKTAEPAPTIPRVSQDRTVIIRDLVIFQLKLLLDGVKDIILSPLSVLAAGLDLIAPTEKRGKRLYAVLMLGERFDHWLSLYKSMERASSNAEGLFGASRAGANDLLGKLEELVIGRVEEEDEGNEDEEEEGDVASHEKDRSG